MEEARPRYRAPSRSSHAWLALCACAAVGLLPAGCGARSSLGVGVSGAGGGSATTAPSSTSSGPTGPTTTTGSGAGGRAACSALVRAGDPTPIVASDAQLHRPVLTPLDTASAEVAVVFDAESKDGATSPRIQDVVIAPWGTWPPTGLDQRSTLAAPLDDSFATAGGQAGTFSMLYFFDGMKVPPQAAFDGAVPPAGPVAGAVVDPSAVEGTATFAARSGRRALLGYQALGVGPEEQLAVAWIDTAGAGGPRIEQSAACGLGQLGADAVGTSNGFLMAAATNRAFGACDPAMVTDGAPLQIEVLTASLAGALSPGATLKGADPVGPTLRLTPRSDGAWLVLQRFTQDQQAGAIQAVRVGLDGQLAGPLVEVVPQPADTSAATSFAATAMGDGLVVAQLTSADLGAVVRLVWLDAGGAPMAKGELPADGELASAGISVLGSPAGTEVLVAWAESPRTGGFAGAHVVLARLGCPGG